MSATKQQLASPDDFALELEEQEKPVVDQVPFKDEEPEHAEDHGLLADDLEAQKPAEVEPQPSADIALEHTIPTRTKLVALGLYFLCNVGLTLYNKAVLGPFHYPWLLTALHTGSAAVGCFALMRAGYFELSNLTRRENLSLVAFSFLFTMNIAISNVSLAMVSIPFHQVIRATCPLVTTLIYRVVFSRTYATATYLSLMPVVLGVSLATFGDYSYTKLGFALTFLGVILAALKTIVTNRLMTGSLKLPPIEFLFRMSPLACVQSLIYGVLSGEVSDLMSRADGMAESSTSDMVWAILPTVLILLGNGLLAFLLNVSSFNTNKLVGALTMAVCGNVKQCLTIVLGVILFNVHVGLLNASGLVVTSIGAAIFSYVELDSKGKLKKASAGAGKA